MNIKKYLTCLLLISTETLAMELSNTDITPPTITYNDYVMTLCVNESIGNWGSVSGNFASWHRVINNANLLKHTENKQILVDLPFFL